MLAICSSSQAQGQHDWPAHKSTHLRDLPLHLPESQCIIDRTAFKCLGIEACFFFLLANAVQHGVALITD